ncbi:MAG: von Willebrand factor, type [Acidobacteria bacterium]|nr:von Willebrand factor, type [Acidobacteriota bacterium]
MNRALASLLLAFSAATLLAQTPAAATPPGADNRANLTIALEPLGDTDQGVVSRLTFRFSIPEDVPPGIPLAVVGSIGQNGGVLKTFRFLLQPGQPSAVTSIQTIPPGEVDVDARLMIPLEEETPVIVGKTSRHFTVAKTNKVYLADVSQGAESVLAEGVVPEVSGAVRILPPRRDIAPNLFIVDVAIQPPVKRVEFFVEGKKILARNSPPYRAELDLGKLPKQVEVRAVGYDAAGHYVDADAFMVNERETPLEVKITRIATPDGVTHFKLSVHNPKNTNIQSVTLFAGQKKLVDWTHPPYAFDIPTAKLAGIEFVRASVVDETSYEAADLLFLTGDRYTEEIDVDLVELPVRVSGAVGEPLVDLQEREFHVTEDGKPQKVTSFNFASKLPISVGLLIDHSGSMEKRMEATRAAATGFLKKVIKAQDRAFVAGFSFDATKLAPFVSDVASLEAQVENIPKAGGGTSLYDAIVTGLYRFRGAQGRKALIILTDGEDTTSRIPYDDMLAYTRSARVPLYFIGIGLGISDFSGSAKMKSLAAETGGLAYFIKDVKQLSDTYDRLEKDLRSQYLIAYNTQSTRTDHTYRMIEVKVDRPGATVRTIRGYVP